MEYAIEVQGLTKHYPGFTLDHVSFSVPAGSIVGFIGENGAGKSTTIKALLGLIRPEEGEISLLGKKDGAAFREIKEQIGAAFDESYFPDNLRIKDVDRIMRSIFKTWESDKFLSYCRRFELPGKKTVKEFSKGMKMKLSIAAALSHQTKLLILDEATSGLDPVVRGEMLDLFLDFIQDENHSILISSHITGDLEQVADSIAYLHQGKLLFQEDKDTLLSEYGILRCGSDDLARLPGDRIVHTRRTNFGCETLVKGREEVLRLLPGAVCDPAGIDDIMRFTSGRDKQ